MTTSAYYSLQTPCFIFDEAEFARGINGFRNALKSCFNKVDIGYSVKTNSLPYALRQAGELGCMAEVVSHDEYRLARLCGYTPDQIIYNGPMKSKDTFLEALSGGAIVNIEAKRELEWLDELPHDRQFTIGIRLNINISKISPEDADGEDDDSRFGFSDESGELGEALRHIDAIPNVILAGLHIHRTTHTRSPRFYERSIEYAVSIIEKYHISPRYIDIGGGYFGIFPDKPTFQDYAESFSAPLKRHGYENLRIIIEPGNALTASPFSFLTQVIDVKRVDSEKLFVTTDGSRNDIDPFFRKKNYLKEILADTTGRPPVALQTVSGCTCLEYDRLFSLENRPALRAGDLIIYNNVGAYTMTLSPQFIRLWPRVYAMDAHGCCREIRRQSCASDIMTTSNEP